MKIPIIGRTFEDELAERMAEDMYGTGPDERVRQLRESVLGPQPSPRLVGLLEQLQTEREVDRG